MGLKGSMTETGRLSLMFPLLLLAGCGPGGSSSDRTSGAARSGDSTSTSLEAAAIHSGVVTNAVSVSPVGLYSHSHEGGRDSLCVLPGEGGHFRFGMEAQFGKDSACRGYGTARVSGDKLILNFARSACLVVASYEGDRISLPGALDVSCSDLCTERGALEGVSFPRLSKDARSAEAARDHLDNSLCINE